jgi:chromosomal replication initiation ATPase DnaA
MSIDGRLILDVCAAVRDGGGHCFLLSGPAGCGKTHLLAHLAASEALTAAAGAVAVLRTPFDLIDTAASELAASAKVVLLDNAEFVATGLKALGAQSVLASLFRGAIARRAVLVIATTSSEPPKEIARYWPAPVRVAVPKLSREQAGHVVRLVAESERRSQELMAPVHAAVPWSVVTSLLTTGVGGAAAGEGDDSLRGDEAIRRLEPRWAQPMALRLAQRNNCTSEFETLRRLVKSHTRLEGEARGVVARSLQPSTGVLLHGPHGCGKTLLPLLLCSALPDVPFFYVHAAALFSKYLGDTEAKLRDVFALARRERRAVLVIEDIEHVAASRGSTDSGSGGRADVSRRVLATLLCEMDGVEDSSSVLVVATTSRIADIDPAVLRQGRLETHVHLTPPASEDQTRAMAHAYLAAEVPELQEVVDVVARAMVGRSPAAMERLFRSLHSTLTVGSVRLALTEVGGLAW